MVRAGGFEREPLQKGVKDKKQVLNSCSFSHPGAFRLLLTDMGFDSECMYRTVIAFDSESMSWTAMAECEARIFCYCLPCA